MLQGTPQDQIPPSIAQGPTAIPVQAVDADQLPREKGFTYEEMTSIIGALYLDSAHRAKIQDEQFSAVIEEYDKRIMQLQAEVQQLQENGDSLLKQVATLNRELEARNGARTTKSRSGSASGDDGSDAMSRGR